MNIYYLPGDSHISGRDVEQRHLDILAGVKDAVTVPVAVKLSPYFSATAEMARRLGPATPAGLMLFNRLLQPDIDTETLIVEPAVSLSSASEAKLPMTWIALLHGRIDVDGPCEWMGRKGYKAIDELRGLLAVPVGADETARERGDYVSALRHANSADYGPW